MAQVKIGTDGMPIPDKIQFARQIVIDMTGNANFPTPAPTLASIGTAATALETAYNAAQTARQVAKSKTAAIETPDASLNLLLAQLANYVENTSGGDPAKIDSSGFTTRDVPSGPIGALTPPASFEVTPSDSSGAVNLNWAKVRGAKSYIVERATDAGTLVWGSPATTTKSKIEVAGLNSGTKYWFRVAGIGSVGQGPWSSETSKFAP
jgi:hypothetical protein